MHLLEWIDLVSYAVIGAIGFFWSSTRTKKTHRRLNRELSALSQELIKTQSTMESLRHYASQQARKDKQLQITELKLQQAILRSKNLATLLSRENKKHHLEINRLRLQAIEYQEAARQATEAAQRASTHLIID